MNAKTHSDASLSLTSQSAEAARMTRAANGEHDALQEIVDCHGEMLERLIGRLTAWHPDREDILQEVLLAVWKQAGRYVEQGSCDAWLKRIAVNQVRNHFRLLARMRRKLLDFATQFQHQETASAPDFEEQHEPLHLAMRQLSESDRVIIALFHLEELPGQQVAELVGLDVNNLHVRLSRARQRLRKILEASEGQPQ